MAEGKNDTVIIGGLTDLAATPPIAEVMGGLTTTPAKPDASYGASGTEVVGGLIDPSAAAEVTMIPPSEDGEPRGDWNVIASLDIPIPPSFDRGGLVDLLEEAGTRARRVGGIKADTELGEKYLALGERLIGFAVALRDDEVDMTTVLSQLNPPPVDET